MSEAAILTSLQNQFITKEEIGSRSSLIICEDNHFAEIPLELIQSDPKQPRKTINEEWLNELADSIRSKGVLQPILVMPYPEQGREM